MSLRRRDAFGLLAAGAAAASVVVPARPTRAAPPPVTERRVGVWTRFSYADGAQVRVGRLDAANRPVADLAHVTLPASAVTSAAQLQREVARITVAAVAREWGVPAAECRATGGAVTHPASGQGARLLRWTEFV